MNINKIKKINSKIETDLCQVCQTICIVCSYIYYYIKYNNVICLTQGDTNLEILNYSLRRREIEYFL